MRGLVLLAMTGLLAFPAAAQDRPDQSISNFVRQEIKLAVRTDAKPFIWKDESSRGYRGLFWNICSTAVERAGYQFKVVEFTAEKREKLFEEGRLRADMSSPSRLDERVDLVCDPTTITIERMRWFSGDMLDSQDKVSVGRLLTEAGGRKLATYFEFSPILFVANGSFARRKELWRPPPNKHVKWPTWLCTKVAAKSAFVGRRCERKEPAREGPDTVLSFGYLPEDQEGNFCEQKIAVLDDAMKGRGVSTGASARLEPASEERMPSGYLPPTMKTKGSENLRTYEVWGFVTGSTIGQRIEETRRQVTGNIEICTRSLPSHTDAAQEFCEGRLYRYFGDVELVRAAIDDYEVSSARSCNADLAGATTGTYEPYALVVSSEAFPDLPERLTLALYGMFTDGTMQGFFDGQFGKEQQSQYLKVLYQINSIPTGIRPSGSSDTKR